MPKRDLSGAAKRPASLKINDQSTQITELRDEDILVGKGFQYEGHRGNALFLNAIETSIRDFNAAPTRPAKSKIVKRIFDELSETCRFLKLNSSTGYYNIVSEKEARQKISHALRYRSQTTINSADSDVSKPPANPSYEASSAKQQASSPENDIEMVSKNRTSDTAQSNPNVQLLSVDHSSKNNSRDDDSSLFSSEKLEEVLGSPEEYIEDSAQSTCMQHPNNIEEQAKKRRRPAKEENESFSAENEESIKHGFSIEFRDQRGVQGSHQANPDADSDSLSFQCESSIQQLRVGVDAISSLEGDSPKS